MNEEDIKWTKTVLDVSKPFHLEVEVVTCALQAMKNNPELSIPEALTIGLNEWVK